MALKKSLLFSFSTFAELLCGRIFSVETGMSRLEFFSSFQKCYFCYCPMSQSKVMLVFLSRSFSLKRPRALHKKVWVRSGNRYWHQRRLQRPNSKLSAENKSPDFIIDHESLNFVYSATRDTCEIGRSLDFSTWNQMTFWSGEIRQNVCKGLLNSINISWVWT